MLTTPKDFLIRTCSCLRRFNYVSKTDALIKSTKSTAQVVWESRNIPIKNIEIFNYIEEVDQILKWVETHSFTSKYELILRAVYSKPGIVYDDMHVLCSGIIAYRKYRQLQYIDDRIAQMVTRNEWVGSIGETIAGTGQIIATDGRISFNKKSWCVRLVNECGNMIVYYLPTNPNFRSNELAEYCGKIKTYGTTNNSFKYTQIAV